MEILILLFLSSLVLIYIKNLLFRWKILQMKDYRFDRLKEYFGSPEWLKNIFNVINIYLVFAFVASYVNLMYTVFEWGCLFEQYNLDRLLSGHCNLVHYRTSLNLYTFFIISFGFILFLWIFLWLYSLKSILNNKLVKPKYTKRFILVIITNAILSLIYYFIVWFFWSIYFTIFSLLLFTPIFLFISNFLTLPIANHLRNKVIKRAQNKIKQFPKVRKIWITGSYGKSSVKDFLYQLMDLDYPTLVTPENKNNEMWVSETIISSLNDNYRYFIAEMWAYKKWEIRLLGNIVNHRDWFLTGINTQHISLFGSQKNIIEWKSEIIEKIYKNHGTLYINYDNEHCKNIELPRGIKYVSYALHNAKAKAISQIIEVRDWMTVFDFVYWSYEQIYETNLIGAHNILNLTWAIACAIDNWVKKDKIIEKVKDIKLPKWNMNFINSPDWNILIDDTYNLNETWIFAWVNVLNSYKEKIKILVLDDIIELGKETKNIHNKIWMNLSGTWLDYIMLVWKNYSKIVLNSLLEANFPEYKIIKNTEELREILKKWNNVAIFEWRETKKYLDKIM